MGIYLDLIDERAPGGFEIIAETTGGRAHRRLRITAGETMAAIARRVCDECRPHSLDVIRICTHGSAALPDIQLGARLNATNASQFCSIRSRWRVTYTVDDYGLRYRLVIPRIEVHSCGSATGCPSMLQALADATAASVFAGYGDQDVGRTFAMEGRLARFNPRLGRPR